MFAHIGHKYDIPELVCVTTPTLRTYETPAGNKYPSVTTVLSGAQDESKKKGLEEWRKRVGPEEAERISRVAANRGEEVHLIAERYLDNDPDWKKGIMPINLLTFNDMRKTLDNNVNNIIAQEVPLYSDKLKTAGRVDLIAEWKGELAIIDFKTSKRAKKKEWITSYFHQMSFYAAAFYERTGVAIKKGVIVMVTDDGECLVFEISTFEYLKEFIVIRKKFQELFNM